jgi:hypothetical protein
MRRCRTPVLTSSPYLTQTLPHQAGGERVAGDTIEISARVSRLVSEEKPTADTPGHSHSGLLPEMGSHLPSE